ncbi:MAG: roadblock/LC7 domain-containing protein [Candidatus Thiodiazotropha sp.]
MHDQKQKIDSILGDFVMGTASIQAAAVMSRDGILIASRLHKSVNPDRLSAISASILSLANRASSDLQQGNLEQVLIDSSDGFLLMVKVGSNAVLSVVSRPSSRLGMLLHDTKKSAATLAALLQ